MMKKNFLIMKVNYDSDAKNEEFLSKYPKIPAYPHYFVLNSNGKFLHSQGTGELEKGKSYDGDVFVEFLNKWVSP